MSPALPLSLEHQSFLTFCKDTRDADGLVISLDEKKFDNQFFPGSYVQIGRFASDADILYQDEIKGSRAAL